MTKFNRRFAIITLALLGCSSARDGSDLEGTTALAKQHLDIPKTASVPWPVQLDDVTHEPLQNSITNKPVSAWDGNYSELLVADAYARCIGEFGGLESQLYTYFNFAGNGQFPGIFSDAEGGLKQVEGRIANVGCELITSTTIPYKKWILSRSNPGCNIDPATGQKAAAIPAPEANWSAPPFQYASWMSTQHPTLLGGGAYVDSMIVGYTSLCVAQRVSEDLENSLVFSSTADEHMYLLGTAHEQATVATNVLGRIVQLAARAESPPSGSSSQPGAILWAWLNTNADAKVTVVQDYLRAVRLMTSLTTQFGSYLERQAGARWTTSPTSDAYERDWGRDSARSRLMTMVFGGGAIWDAFTGNSSTGEVPVSPAWFGKVRQASDDPRVRVLLELARSANTIILWGDSLDVASYNGPQIYTEVEIYLRQSECQWRDQPCTRSDILSQLPPIENYSSYLLYNQYKVTPTHANALAQSLFDAAKSSLSIEHIDGSDFPVGTFDLTGAKSTTTIDGLQFVTIERDTHFLPFRFEDWAQRSYYVLSPNYKNGGEPVDGYDEVAWNYVYPDRNDFQLHLTQLGAFPSLAFARKVLFDLTGSGFGDVVLQQTEADVLSDVERLTGRTTIIKSPGNVTVIQPTTVPGWKLVSLAAGQNAVHNSVIVSPLDVRGASRNPSYKGIPTGSTSYPTGFSRTDLDSLANGPDGPTSAAPDHTTPSQGLGLTKFEWSSAHYDAPSWLNCSVVLYSTANNKSVPSYIYLGSREATGKRWETAVGIEGWLVDLVSRVTAVQDSDWSRPRYDGFGLPQKWVPPADASLLGGSAGQESYSYLLQAAKSAAEDATAAVKTAIDGLSEQTRDDSALEQAETRASQAAQQDQTALCHSGTCDLEMVTRNFRWNLGDFTAFTSSPEGTRPCKTALNYLNADAQHSCFGIVSNLESNVLPGNVRLPKIVADALVNTEASFSDYEGSELQRVLLRQWNAARALLAARDQLGELAVSYGLERQAANAADGAAQAAYLGVLANSQFKIDQLTLSLAQYDLQATEVLNNLNTAQEAVNVASYHAHNYCDLNARVNEICVNQHVTYVSTECDGNWGEDCVYPRAEYDWPAIDQCKAQMGLANPNALIDDAVYCTGTNCGMKQGEGDTDLAANMRCKDASVELITATNRLNDASIANQLAQKVTDAELALQDSGLYEAAQAERTASDQYAAQVKQSNARIQQAYAQFIAQFGVVRQTVSEQMLSLAELDSLRLKVGLSASRAELETNLANENWGTSMKLRRKYRSYDLWRARALLENARRLAVTARRAIETRYVVNLSTLTADQPFVASPSIWADEVFESDLNAPAVVGLSITPQIDSAIYPNKLIDYVGNLERFVQGYAIAYPTSISLPDTEVVSISGPDRLSTSADGSASYLSQDTAGWRFYCANTGQWISHPGVGQYPIPASNRLATACNDQPPTKALYSFWLDPWGVMQGAYTRPAYSDRHNVRWRRLAVNLVGTGIRDCSKAADSTDCYTNPFIRFNLTHAGPSWQTNYSSDWRSLDTPTARIEGGKALAAEEWLEPVSTSWNMAYVSNVARGELFGRPMAGNYELTFDITPDIRLDHLERVQLLVEEDYWVRQGNSSGIDGSNFHDNGTGGASGTGGAPGTGGNAGTGGSISTGGSGGTGGTSGAGLYGLCTPDGTDRRVDDFEDFNKQIGTWDQRLGLWYGVHAGTCTASPATTDSFTPVSGGYNGSLAAGYASGTGCDAGNWAGGGIGFTLISSLVNNVTSVCANYDASRYSGIELYAKGTGTVRLEVCTSDLADDNCHGYDQALTANWTHYSFTWSQLAQNPYWGAQVGPINPAHIKKIQFLSATANYEFWIDNLSFTN